MSDSVIKRLRRKIVLVSIVAVFVSLLALIFAINYAHYRQVDASLHSALAEIASESDMGLRVVWAISRSPGRMSGPASKSRDRTACRRPTPSSTP